MLQGSQEWLEWRRGGIGSSEVPTLMGEDDRTTPLEIWKIKKGHAQERDQNFVMRRGTENEPKIRALYEIEYGLEDFPPATFQHPDLEWARASLDGFNEGLSRILEIKYSGKENFELAKRGIVPACYVGQVQYQLFVTGANDLHFVVFNGEEIAVVHVLPDPEYWSRMLPVLEAFWQRVVTGTAPALTDRDCKDASPDLCALLEEWKANHLAGGSSAKKRDKELREMIGRQMDHPKIRGRGVLVSTVRRKTGATLSFRIEEGA